MPPEQTVTAPLLNNDSGVSSSGGESRVVGETAASMAPSRRYWYIHGKAYDLTDFVDQHPGGRNNLLETRGLNVTELFESVHALSSRNVSAMLSKYEVKGELAQKSPFTYAEDGTYKEISRRVREMFAGSSYKANTKWWVILSFMLAAYVVSLYYAFVDGSPLISFVSGSWMMVLFFYGIVHDASHYGMSKRPWVNTFWSILSCHWGLWHSNVWFQHHCYGHHSYTGVAKMEGRNQHDPDLRWTPWLRKSPWFKLQPIHKFQQFFMYVLFLLLPNQYVYQSQMYIRARLIGKIFGIHVSDYVKTRALWEAVMSYTVDLLSLTVHFGLPLYYMPFSTAFLSIWLYWSGAGLMYFLMVAPNHDTHGTDKLDKPPYGMDWGEMQIRHSSNFAHGSSLLTSVFGGMNYQIEHHLFPAVSNIHYPAISKIVRAVCEERGIPYNYYPSVWEAHKSVWENYRDLGGKPYEKNKSL